MNLFIYLKPQYHLAPSRLSICLICYFTLLALLWQRLLLGVLLPPFQVALGLMLGCVFCLTSHLIASLHFKKLISLAILHKTMTVKICALCKLVK